MQADSSTGRLFTLMVEFSPP